MNGSPGLIYMESVAQASDRQHHLEFPARHHPDPGAVDVQNRLSRAAPRLPRRDPEGVRVDKARSKFCCLPFSPSDDPALTPVALGDFASRSIVPELQRLPGVGQVQLVWH